MMKIKRKERIVEESHIQVLDLGANQKIMITKKIQIILGAANNYRNRNHQPNS